MNGWMLEVLVWVLVLGAVVLISFAVDGYQYLHFHVLSMVHQLHNYSMK